MPLSPSEIWRSVKTRSGFEVMFRTGNKPNTKGPIIRPRSTVLRALSRIAIVPVTTRLRWIMRRLLDM